MQDKDSSMRYEAARFNYYTIVSRETTKFYNKKELSLFAKDKTSI